MIRRNPTDALVAAARANFLRPPGRDARVLRAARAAVRGVETFAEAWEILQSRDLIPMDMPPPWGQYKPSGRNLDAKAAALIASDVGGFATAARLAMEANDRVEQLIGMRSFPGVDETGSKGLSVGIGKRDALVRWNGDRYPFDSTYPVDTRGVEARTADPMFEALRVASNAFGLGVGRRLSSRLAYPEIVAVLARVVDELRAMGEKAWIMPGTSNRNTALLWRDFDNPYDPILELLALGYMTRVAPIMTWLLVPESTK